MITVTRLFDIPYYQQTKYPLSVALATKVNGIWQETSTDEYIKKVNIVRY